MKGLSLGPAVPSTHSAMFRRFGFVLSKQHYGPARRGTVPVNPPPGWLCFVESLNRPASGRHRCHPLNRSPARNWVRSRGGRRGPRALTFNRGNDLRRWQIGFDRRVCEEGPEPRRAPGLGSMAGQRTGTPRGPGRAQARQGHDTDSRIVKERASRHDGILNP